MGKNTTKNLVGQPIFRQIIQMLPRDKFDVLVLQQKSDKGYRTFSSWEQLMVMLFGIFSRCDSMGEVCDGMRALEGKLNYLGMDCSPAKSTAGDALRARDNEFLKLLYFVLLSYFRPLMSVSRKKKEVSFEEFYAFDSTTIALFSEVMKGVGRNPKGDGKKKGGLKVHMPTDVHSDMAVFATVSEAKMHDRKFLSHLKPAKGSMLVFDRVYNYYRQFAEWTEEGVNFVCRLKVNAKYEVQEDKPIYEKKLEKDEYGVYKVEHIHMKYKKEKKEKTLCLRLVHYKDEKGRKYKFITNNWEIAAEEVAPIYKHRWTIELTFKKLKQNFQLHFFYSETGNGIKTQIWCTLIAHLLLQVIKAISESEKAFSTIAALIRIHLISRLDINWLLTEGRRYYKKSEKSKNKSPATAQLSLF